MRYDGHKVNPEEKYAEEAIEERTKYGVSTVDTWGFDSYLLAVLTNGLQDLAENANGWPSGEKYPRFEDWRDALIQASDDAYWCLVTFEELENDAYREAYPQNLEDFDSIDEFLESQPVTEEANIKWREAREKLNEEREMRKDRLFNFVKENLWALWD